MMLNAGKVSLKHCALASNSTTPPFEGGKDQDDAI
jgi:hypothetical protein